MLADTHAHLDYPALANAPGGLPGVLERAAAHGVTRVVAVATSLDSARACAAIARQHRGGPVEILPTAGIHPTDDTLPAAAADLQATRDALASLLATGSFAAIGETGLDHFRLPKDPVKSAPAKEAQERLFRVHLDLAAETGLPVIVHQRACWADTLRVLRDYIGRARCVLHCFAGSAEEAREVLALGHLVSFTGILTFSNGAAVLNTAVSLPPGSFMIETDAPYLTPEPHRGKPCEPWHVRLTAEKLAAARREPLETLAAHTTQTAARFFRSQA